MASNAPDGISYEKHSLKKQMLTNIGECEGLAQNVGSVPWHPAVNHGMHPISPPETFQEIRVCGMSNEIWCSYVYSTPEQSTSTTITRCISSHCYAHSKWTNSRLSYFYYSWIPVTVLPTQEIWNQILKELSIYEAAGNNFNYSVDVNSIHILIWGLLFYSPKEL